ncbi:hypothetical protein PAMP_002766 [Pampus punctatissimus]
MTGAVTVFLICCLLQDSLCQNFAAFIPQTVNGLIGSCVNIPCSFQIDPDDDKNLDDSCKALWRRRSDNEIVFDSSRTGADASLNILQGNLIGILSKKDCTTILNMMSSNSNHKYYFRLQCDNKLKYNFKTNVVFIDVQDSLSSPTIITPSRLEVEEGTPVRLNCSAAAPCPTSPPTLTWTPTIGDAEDHMETKFVASVMSFTASYLHNEQNISCTAVYNRQAGSDLSYEISLTPRVFFSPKETSVIVKTPGPVVEGSSVTLFCSSRANPPVTNYTWYKDGEEDKEHRQSLVIDSVDLNHSGNYCCKAKNDLGEEKSASIQLDIQYAPKNTSVIYSGPVKEGNSVTLTCSTNANPAVDSYTWYKVNGDEVTVVGFKRQLSYTVSAVDNKFYCTVSNKYGAQNSSITLIDVQYAPKNTSVIYSGPVKEGNSVTLTCSTNANPAVDSYTWYKVNGDEVTVVGFKRQLSYTVSAVDNKFYCTVSNKYGAQNSSITLIDVQFIHTVSLLIGAAVGALGMLLMCAPLLLFLCRKTKGSISSGNKLVDTSDFLVTNETNSSQVNTIYANEATIEEDEGVKEDTLHFADLDFTKLQAKSDGKMEGEIRGLASKTAVYAEIRLHSRGNDGEEEKGERTISDNHFGQTRVS